MTRAAGAAGRQLRIGEQRAQRSSNVGGVVAFARYRHANTEFLQARGIVELIVTARRHQLRHTGAQRLGRSADAAVVHERCGARQQHAEGRVIYMAHIRWQWLGQLCRELGDQRGAAPEQRTGRRRSGEKIPASGHRRSAGEDNRRCAAIEIALQARRHGLDNATVIEREIGVPHL